MTRGGKLPLLCEALKITYVLASSAIHNLKTDDKLQILIGAWRDIVSATTKCEQGTCFILRYVPIKGGHAIKLVPRREAHR